MSHEYLNQARANKKDEFYTRYEDVQREMECYLSSDPDVFRGKSILLPCDNPVYSQFTRYFLDNFTRLGLRELVSTGITGEEHGVLLRATPDNIERQSGERPGLEPLKGDGDFQSDEVTELRNWADIIITNPPFSLFRPFFQWLTDSGKQFSVIGNQNSVTHSEVFPYIMNNTVWLGNGFKRTVGFFYSIYPDNSEWKERHEEGCVRVPGVVWFTNIHYNRDIKPLVLLTMEENTDHGDCSVVREYGYEKFDGQDILNVPMVCAIPSDYYGVMGVPISFINYYDPDKFQIVGMANHGTGQDDWFCPKICGVKTYKRLLIQRLDVEGE